MTPVPRTLHLLVRRSGGGTETNVNRLCAAVPEFEAVALEDYLGKDLSRSRIPAAIRALRELNPAVVFCYGITAHIIARMAFSRNIPLVGNIRCESDFSGIKGIWKSAFERQFFPWVSNSKMALKGAPGIVIYNGIDDPGPENALLPEIKGPAMGILASGNTKKGHDFALELWDSMGRPGSLVFAGNLGEELKARAESGGVICPGFVPPGPLLRSLDLLLVPSTAEGIPTVLLEAMVRGVPTLSTPVGGIPELVAHGETGYVLPRPEWRAFLHSLDWAAARRIGAAGREHVLQNFSFTRMKDQFIDAARLAASRHLPRK